MTERTTEPRRPLPHGLVMLLLGVFCLFPTLHGPRWGDGLEFVAVSAHLGVAHPSGYPLFTLLGWIALKLPIDEAYNAVLVLCRLAAFATTAVIYLAVRELFLYFRQTEWLSRLLALNIALAFCFSDAIRQSLHFVEIYILHGAFLVTISYVALRPVLQDRSPHHWELLAAGGLFGLAISNHLTSLAILPLVVYFLVTGVRGGRLPAAIGGGVLLLLLPLLLYGTLPLRNPGESGHGIFWGDPQTTGELIDHIRGGEYRHYRFMSVAPGVAFTFGQYIQFFVTRVALTLESSGRLFFGATPVALPLGFLVVVAFAWGCIQTGGRRDLRWTMFFLLLAIFLQLGFVFTYNIPDVDDYFLGIQVLALPIFAVGLLIVLRSLFEKLKWPGEKQNQILRLFSLIFLIAVYMSNFDAARVENAKVYSAWTERVFAALPEDAALITSGDGDIYAAWYKQFAMNEREDVLVYGANFMRFPWFRKTIRPSDPHRVLVGFAPGPPGTLEQHIDNLSRLVINPLLNEGRPVFTTISNPMELEALADRFRVRPMRNLLTESEMEALASTHEVFSIFPMLYELQSFEFRPTP
ncbi:MAG: DUF2723 domain-containing protein [Candidatus Sumerlaeia bacterium]|nr:DUF2723 domain-containing protein [Candidatus Sumerlaeia bacterium]